MNRKKILSYIFLLGAILLVSFNAFAHETQTGAAQESCACQLFDQAPAEGDGQPEHSPDSHGGGGCCCQECCADALNQSVFSGVSLTVSVNQLMQLHPDSFFPVVYLTIFVPPENSSLI